MTSSKRMVVAAAVWFVPISVLLGIGYLAGKSDGGTGMGYPIAILWQTAILPGYSLYGLKEILFTQGNEGPLFAFTLVFGSAAAWTSIALLLTLLTRALLRLVERASR